jgi:hypothetical protein
MELLSIPCCGWLLFLLWMNLWADSLLFGDLCRVSDIELCKRSVTCLTNVQTSTFLRELLAKRLPSGETRIMKPPPDGANPLSAPSEGGNHDRARRRGAFSEMAHR